jgi:hypothetical protein
MSLVALAAIACSGCSFMSVTTVESAEKEARSHRTDTEVTSGPQRLECTDSRATPILDTVVAGLAAINGAAVAVAPKMEFDRFPGGQQGVMATAFGIAAVSAISAAWGFGATSECIAYNKRIEPRDPEEVRDAEVKALRDRVRKLEQER